MTDKLFLKGRAGTVSRGATAWLMLLPLAAALVLFAVFPSIYVAALSFTKSTLGQPFRSWIGWANYYWLLGGGDRVFVPSLLRATIFAVVVSMVELALGLALAVRLTSLRRGGRLLRSVLLLPLMTPPVLVGVAWKLLLAPGGGRFALLPPLHDFGIIRSRLRLELLQNALAGLLRGLLPIGKSGFLESSHGDVVTSLLVWIGVVRSGCMRCPTFIHVVVNIGGGEREAVCIGSHASMTNALSPFLHMPHVWRLHDARRWLCKHPRHADTGQSGVNCFTPAGIGGPGWPASSGVYRHDLGVSEAWTPCAHARASRLGRERARHDCRVRPPGGGSEPVARLGVGVRSIVLGDQLHACRADFTCLPPPRSGFRRPGKSAAGLGAPFHE